MSGGPPNMLTYESAMPARISAVRQAACVSLLVVGMLTIFGGLWAGAILAIAVLTHSPLPSQVWILRLACVVVSMSIGVTQAVCSVKIWSKSAVAAIIAAVIGGLELVVVVGAMVLLIVTAAAGVTGPILYAAVGCALGVVEWLVIKVIGEGRRRFY